MKKVLFFIIAVAAVSFVACGGDGLAEVFAEAGYSGTSGSGSGSSSSSDGCVCTFKLNGVTSDVMEILGDDWTAVKKSLDVSTCSELETNYQNGYYSAFEVSCTSN